MKRLVRNWWSSTKGTLEENAWAHLWGAPLSGKTTFAHWLREATIDADREVLFLSLAEEDGKTLRQPGALLRLVLAAANLQLSDESLTTGLQPGLVPALARADRRLLLILDGVEACLTSEAGLLDLALSWRGKDGDPECRLKLLTTAIFPITAVLRFREALADFETNGFDELHANWFDEDADEFDKDLENIAVWAGDLKPRLVQMIVSRAHGHPGLTLLVAQKAVTESILNPSAERTLNNCWDAMRDTPAAKSMFSWLTDRIWTSLEARLHIRALEYFLGDADDETHDKIGCTLAVALGLIHPELSRRSEQSHSAFNAYDNRPDYLVNNNSLMPGLKKSIEMRRDDLRTRMVHVLEADEARISNESDSVLQAVLDLVQREFCNSPRGLARDTIIADNVITLIPRKQYSLTLGWRHENELSRVSGQEQREALGRRFSSLRMFFGLEESYRDAWQHEFSILRELSNTGHPSFPDFRQNATLVDKAGDGKTYGFILVENEGRKLDEVILRFFRNPDNRRAAYREIRSLVTGLVRLQARGLVHRLISPQTIRVREKSDDFFLVYGGFEIVTGAHIASGSDPERGQVPISAALMQSLVGGRAARRFVEPSAQSIFFEDEQDLLPEAVMPQSDVFGLCMTLCDLFYGPPPISELNCFVAAENGVKAKAELEALLAAYCDFIRNANTDVISPTLREIILLGLNREPRERATASDLQKALLDNAVSLEEDYRVARGATFLLVYHAGNMLTELGRNLHYLLDFDPYKAETAPHDLHRFITGKLRAATSIFKDPNGFSRFVTEQSRVTNSHAEAQIVIVCSDISFYCTMAKARNGVDIGDRALELRYTLARHNHALAGLVEDDERRDFPNTEFAVWHNETPDLVNGTLHKITLDGKDPVRWEQWLAGLKPARVPEHLEVAYDSLTFVTEVMRHQRRLLTFPVDAQLFGPGSREMVLKLDKTAFLARVDRDPYLSLLFNDEKTEAHYFFQNALVEWLDRNSGPDDFICFRPENTDRNIRLAIETQDVIPGAIRLRRIPEGLEGKGTITYSDDVGIYTLHRTQMQALGRIRSVSRVLDQLQRPHPTQALSRAKPLDFGRDLKGSAAQIIWHMVNAHPLFLLQGPPGTGKTRALTEFVYHVLSQEDATAKFLLTAQSHASVDTTLERIAEALQVKEGTRDLSRFHIIRHMPGSTQQSVSHAVREKYDVARQVEKLADRIRERAREARSQLSDAPTDGGAHSLQERGLKMLEDVHAQAHDEVERRFKRNASLHFVTTSSSGKGTTELLDFGDKFHTAIVEEAATAWGVGLIQPMVEAHSAVLIGDHRQIGPFDSARIARLARVACGERIDSETNVTVERTSPPIFPKYQDNPSVMTAWMEPFRRVFMQIEAGELNKTQAGVVVADTLTTQFRSVRQIGDLVSKTFYSRENVQWGGVEFDQARAVLNLTSIFSDKQRDPALAWLNTARLGASALHRRNNAGGIENHGEIRVLLNLLAHNRTRKGPIQTGRESDPDFVPINERLLILSPYRSQVEAIRRRLRDDPVRYGFSDRREEALRQIDDVTRTVDSAQGAEANTVIVSMARAVDVNERDVPAPGFGSSPIDWVRAIRRNYGFLTQPERINVLFSRARQQLVVIGNFEFFDSLVDYTKDWSESYGYGTSMQAAIAEEQGFWHRLLAYLYPTYVVNLSTHGRTDFE